jgi:hypothetical protein
MRRLSALSVLILVIPTLVGACSVLGERGSGTMTSEARDVSGFDAIDLSGSGTVRISVTGSESVTVEAEDNILPLLTTEVRGGTLVLGAKQSISPTREIVYTITAVSLTAVTVSGSGSVTATDVDAGTFEVDISGSGTVAPTRVRQRRHRCNRRPRGEDQWVGLGRVHRRPRPLDLDNRIRRHLEALTDSGETQNPSDEGFSWLRGWDLNPRQTD